MQFTNWQSIRFKRAKARSELKYSFYSSLAIDCVLDYWNNFYDSLSVLIELQFIALICYVYSKWEEKWNFLANNVESFIVQKAQILNVIELNQIEVSPSGFSLALWCRQKLAIFIIEYFEADRMFLMMPSYRRDWTSNNDLSWALQIPSVYYFLVCTTVTLNTSMLVCMSTSVDWIISMQVTYTVKTYNRCKDSNIIVAYCYFTYS